MQVAPYSALCRCSLDGFCAQPQLLKLWMCNTVCAGAGLRFVVGGCLHPWTADTGCRLLSAMCSMQRLQCAGA